MAQSVFLKEIRSMWRPKRNSVGVIAFARVVARAVLAACLALSFFASLVPLRASADDGAMDCCAGKVGHCNSGLVLKQPATKPKLKPEPLCGLKADAEGEGEATTVDAGAPVGDSVEADTAYDAITVDATSSGVTNKRATDSAGRNETSGPDATETTANSTATPTSPSFHSSFAQPCPPDCRAGTAAVVRQPRPREAALLVKNSRGVFAATATWKPHSHETNLAISATLKRARPRGPPCAA